MTTADHNHRSSTVSVATRDPKEVIVPSETRTSGNQPPSRCGVDVDQQRGAGLAWRSQQWPMPARSGAEARRVQPASTRLSSSLADEPAPGGARAAAFRVTPDPRAVAPARHFLKSTLASWGVDEDAIAAAILCLSELITNAIIHARTGCEVRAVLDRGVLTTTVRDRGSAVVGPRGQTEDSLAVHGRGLRLVDTLATRWGCQLDAIGTTAWFVLEPTLQTNN